MPVEQAYRIRTGESGEETLQAHPDARRSTPTRDERWTPPAADRSRGPRRRLARAAARRPPPRWSRPCSAGAGSARSRRSAAEAAGAPVAVVVPRLARRRARRARAVELGALRRYVGERCAAGRSPVPDGVAAEAPIESGGELSAACCCSATRPAAEGRRVPAVAALAALTEVAVAGGRAEVEQTAARLVLRGAALARRPPSADEVVRRARAAGLRPVAAARSRSAPSSRPSARATSSRGSPASIRACSPSCLEAAASTRSSRPRRGRRGDVAAARRWPTAAPPRAVGVSTLLRRPGRARPRAGGGRAGARRAAPRRGARSARTSARAPTGCCSACSPRTPTRCARSTRTRSRRSCATTSPTAPSWSRPSRRSSSTTAPPRDGAARSTCTATRRLPARARQGAERAGPGAQRGPRAARARPEGYRISRRDFRDKASPARRACSFVAARFGDVTLRHEEGRGVHPARGVRADPKRAARSSASRRCRSRRSRAPGARRGSPSATAAPS